MRLRSPKKEAKDRWEGVSGELQKKNTSTLVRGPGLRLSEWALKSDVEGAHETALSNIV